MGELIQLGGSGGTPSANNPDYYGGDIPFLSIADINGRNITNTAKTLTDEGLQNSAAWIVPSGAVSLAMYASVGKVGIIRQDTATSQAFYNMAFDNEALRDFVFTRLEKAEADSEWEPYISTGTQRNLNADKVKSFSLDIPSIEEASEISAYFANLDCLITLHQRKCQYRGLYGYLSWEQRKLGDIAPVTMGQSPNGACYTDNPNDAVLVQGNADLKDGWVFPRVWTTEITKTAKAGDLIMSVRAPVGAMGKTAYDVVLGRGVAGIAGNEFLFQALSKKEAEGYWSTVSAGSTFDSINGDELRNTPVDYPRSKPEREAVGSCLSRIDSLITLHQ